MTDLSGTTEEFTAALEGSHSISRDTVSESISEMTVEAAKQSQKDWDIVVDHDRDNLLTDFGKETLKDRYLLPGETYQDLFVRVAKAYADDQNHAQRLYDYISKLWFMPATPVLSNGGTNRGLPISCYLNSVPDSLEGIAGVWDENVWLGSRGGGIGCVDSETEYLTLNGWKRIADYVEGEKVFTVDPKTMTGEFLVPEKYVDLPATDMYHFKGMFSDMVLSGNHRNFVKMNGREEFNERTTAWLLEENRYKRARFQPSVSSIGGSGLPYAELELRFLVALAADGCNVLGRPDVKFVFTHQRKIERMRWLLSELGVEHNESLEKHKTLFYIADRGIQKKPLTFENFGNANVDQLKIIFDELGHWDGSFDHRNAHLRFSTMKVLEADFVQYVIMSVTGKRAGLGCKTRDNEYVVRQTNDSTLMVSSVEPFHPTNGRQYCFQTSTTYWLARRGNSIFVTGNTYWSNVRGIGEPVDKNGKTSGIIPFIHVMDSLTLAISQGSLRRSSAAAYLDISHPEIEEFLEIRKPSGDFNRKALNLHHGICIPDSFMHAVRNNEEWKLKSPKDGSVKGTVNARALFQKIVETRLATGEPYLLFIDIVNRAVPEFQKKSGLSVTTSNLCVAPETRILTKQGYVRIDQVAGTYQQVWNGKCWSTALVAKTGENQKLVSVYLSNGVKLDVTPYHKWKIQTGYGSHHTQMVSTYELQVGDKLVKPNFEAIPDGGDHWDEDLAYLNGFYTADGCDDARGNPRVYLYADKRHLINFFMRMYPTHYNLDENGGIRDTFYYERGMLAPKFTVPLNCDRATKLNWLAGFLDGDGTVTTNGDTQTIQCSSIHKEFLQDVRLMLTTLGVDPKIAVMAEAGDRLLPDGHGGSKLFPCATTYRLIITAGDSQRLLNLGLKLSRLKINMRETQRDAHQFVRVVSIVDEGRYSDTYCFNEPIEHMGVFEGVLTGNCSEITLPTGKDHHGQDRTAVCCLSSLNFETWDEWSKNDIFIEDVMRFLDNVLQDYIDRAEPTMRKARYSALRERSVGLGVMGFHSFLQSKSIPFEGALAKSWNMRFFKHIKKHVDAASVKLAQERGACPDAAEHGVMERFACKTAIAPTASISIICGGTSACIEPIPANIYTHKTLSGSFVVKNIYLEKLLDLKGMNTESVWTSILEHDGSVQHLDALSQDEKDCFKTSFEIDQRFIIEFASDRTPYIDQSQSINLFIPPDVEKWDLLMLHMRAWELSVKSLYYLRSKSAQRAGFAGSVAEDNTLDKPVINVNVTDYDECSSCQ